MNVEELVAIDVHTHAEISVRDPQPPTIFQEAAQKYFKHATMRSRRFPQIAAYYRERKMACVIFSVDGLRARGIKPVSNEEVAELAAENSDVMIPFASIDPASGAAGVREARRLIEHYGVKGFKFHPQFQEFFPDDRAAYPLYEVIAEHELPALFHTGHSGMGTGMPGGGGIRLKYGNPMHVDDVAVDFPTMPIVLAHPSWPWQDEALSIALAQAAGLHRPLGLVAEVLSAAARAIREHAAQAQSAVRHRLPADHAGALARRFREDRHSRRRPAADSQAQRHRPAQARRLMKLQGLARCHAVVAPCGHRESGSTLRTIGSAP